MIPVLIFLGCYEILLRSSNLPNIYSYKDKLLDEEYEAVVLGNSHALRGVLAEELSFSAINLANVSQSIDVDLLWLKAVLKTKKLKFAILNFSTPTYTVSLIQSPENWRLKNYNLYTRLQINYAPKYNFEFLNGLQIKNIKRVGNYVIGNNYPQDNYLEKGSFPLDAFTDDFEEHALKASSRHMPKVGSIESNEKILMKIIELSKMYNFDLIIVTPPAHESYRKLIPNKINNKMFSLLTNLESKNNNVYWLNSFDNTSFDYRDFKDSDHLNLKGAKLFTNQINDFLINRNTKTN
ncbi:hypothetical protein [Psychroserpens mesophilus]|uniref:hypothetical protein n=1 Tax=Psychroserpens mesophilus TaxID=325473 RepID=UPI003D651A28